MYLDSFHFFILWHYFGPLSLKRRYYLAFFKKGHNWEPIIAALFSSFDKATIVCVVPTET